MSNHQTVSRAIVSAYLWRLGLATIGLGWLLTSAALAVIFYFVFAITPWWLLLAAPVLLAWILLSILLEALRVAVTAIKPNGLSHSQKSAVKKFIKHTDTQAAIRQGLHRSPLAIMVKVIWAKIRGHDHSVTEVLIEPIQQAEQIKSDYQQLVKLF